MTLFAGIYARDPRLPPPAAARDSLRRLLSRDRRDEPAVFDGGRAFLVKADVGAYGEPAWRVDEGGAVSALAGEPLLGAAGGGEGRRGRAEDLAELHGAWLAGDLDILRRARGVFCAAHYSPAGGLTLAADKLCVRPLYYWAGEKYVVFSTALRVLEGLDLVPKELDVRAVAEQVGLGVPLGTRTPYAGVSLLRAGEVLRFDGDAASAHRYWRWDDIAPSARDEGELAREAYALFTEAVARRARGDAATFAFLSGGLDSRAVVGALRARELAVHTFNFSPAGSQDQVFGAGYARLAGTTHHEAPRRDEGGVDWSRMLADAWRAAREGEGLAAERPQLGWSGDGGSVGLGHVYVSAEIVALTREGRTGEAVEAFLRQQEAHVPERFLRPRAAAALSDVLRRGVREELESVGCPDPGRGFHLFLMLNDQRRHLARHFENIDLHRLELQLPFHDGD
ncbi:MAG TPA: asparagine synthase-related protein, partial [Pyrinomonadaceae bacterium]